nr:VanZ family protein [uncultured Desulfobacter sp.]
MATDIIIWVPVGFLWLMRRGKKPGRVFLWTFIAVVAIESVQLFIASRTFDITDIILGTLGGGIGIFLCLNFPFLNLERPENNEATKDKHSLFLIGLGFTILWCLVLAIVFWFPYEVRIERGFVTSQLNRFFHVPFYVYYYSGGLTALTAVFQKSLFFIPLGAALAITSQSLRKYGVNSLLTLIAVAYVAGMGLVIELGQALMPNKIPDSTDLLFETIGGVTGYWFTMIYLKKNE